MKKVFFLFAIVLFFLAPLYLKHPKPTDALNLLTMSAGSPARDAMPPLILATSLRDSLPGETLLALGLEDIQGLKIKYYDGSYASYFTYTTRKQDLVLSLSLLPVPFGVERADVTYRKVDHHEITALALQTSAVEREHDAGFWSASVENYEAYEFLKPPFRHLMLISRVSEEVLHRVTPSI